MLEPRPLGLGREHRTDRRDGPPSPGRQRSSRQTGGRFHLELLSVIRRWRLRDHFSIREISRRAGLSRNTVRKYLRSDIVEPKFNVADRASKLDPHADKLSRMLLQEACRSRKEKRTVKQLHVDLVAHVIAFDGIV